MLTNEWLTRILSPPGPFRIPGQKPCLTWSMERCPTDYVLAMLLMHAKGRRKDSLKLFPFTQVHMNATWQTGVKAADRPHNVDALEGVRAIIFEDRRVLHGILVWSGCAIDVTHTTIPWRRRIGMIVGDLSILDDHVMG